MKIFRLLLIFICLSTSLKLYAQQAPTITLSLKDVPLETVLAQIKKQTGVTFVYNQDIVKRTGRVSVQAQKATLEDVLKQCFRNTPFIYTIFENTVVLSEKKDADGNPLLDGSFFSQRTVRGFIYSTTQQALNGASVIVKRTHQGTITNARGEFTIENIRNTDTLKVSFIGYDSQDVPIRGLTDLSIVLNDAKNELDQVVVQGYGTTTKRLSVGEISQVNAAQIERQPVTNPILALQNIAPGVLVTPTSGYTGAPVRIEIRGRSAIGDVPSDPLYVIDGTPLITPNIAVYKSTYERGGAGFVQSGISNSYGQSPFFSLNPGDIESITILKDASATAIYGSRGGNGVILITTKKGKPGQTQFNVNVDQSINRTIGTWDMLNTTQYLQMRREALRNDGLAPNDVIAPDLTLWDTTRNVNWQKELWQTGKTTDVSTSLSGGNNLIKFRIGAGYSTIQDISALNNQNKSKKATVSLGLNYISANQKLSVDLSALYSYTNVNQIPEVGATTLAPDVPPVFDKNGNLNFAAWNIRYPAGLSVFPFGGLLQSFTAGTNFLNSNINIGYQIINDLKISANLGYSNLQASNKTLVPITSQNPLDYPTGQLFLGNNGNVIININPQVTYSRYIGKGKLSALFGGALTSTTAQGLTLIGSEYTGDELLKSINNAPNKIITPAYSQNKYLALHGRIGYTWEDRYTIELSGNRDGSSAFGPGRQFGNFWSVGANWIASDEKWLKQGLPEWISLIKFSGSYGVAGAAGGGEYQYLSQWAGNGMPYNYNGGLPLGPLHAVNQDYRWQTTRKINTGLDLGFLDDRFALHASFYKYRSNNQISQLPTPLFTGFGTVQGNSKADVQNTGIEVSLQAGLIRTTDFSWSAQFSISHNANKLLAFPGIEYTSSYTTLRVGNSLNTIYLLHYLGIDQQTGERVYQDRNGDGKITTGGGGPPGSLLDDLYIPIDPTPNTFGSISTDFRYKKIAVSLTFGFEKKIGQVAYTGTPGILENVPVSAINNHWQNPGDVATNPKFSTVNGETNFKSSDGGYTDASYLRLQNVNIAYSLPDKFANALGIKGVSFIFSMQNVFTLTKYDGVDPASTFGNKPQPKIFNGRIAINL